MNVGTALRSAVGVFTERSGSLLPVYLLVVGLGATARVPVVVGLAAIFGLLAADGRLETLFETLREVDFEAISQQPDPGPEAIPPEAQAAVAEIFSPGIVALMVAAVGLAVLVSIIANALSSAAAINGVYGCLYDGDGVEDAVVGVGRDWKAFVGLSVLQIAVVVVALAPVAIAVTLFAVSPVAGTAAVLLAVLFSAGILIVGLLALAFAEQALVVDGVGFGTAVRRSVGFPFGRPVAFIAYALVALGVFGALSVLGVVFNSLGVSQLSGILAPLVAVPFLDAFKTALYADRPFESPTETEPADSADAAEPTAPADADDAAEPTAPDEPADTAAADDQPVTDGGDRNPDDQPEAVDEQSSAVDTSSADEQPEAVIDEPSTDTDHAPGEQSSDADSDEERPPYRRRIAGAFRDGLVALGGFVRHQPVAILAAAILFAAATASGWQLTNEFALDLPGVENTNEIFGTLPVGTFVMIAANNWLVSATAIYGGVALGVPTAVDMALNGFIVGALAGVVDPLAFVALVGPHGIVELPAIIVAGGLGFHLAATVAGTLRGSKTSAELADVLRLAYRVLLGLAVVLVIASFIETFLTPRIAGLVLT